MSTDTDNNNTEDKPHEQKFQIGDDAEVKRSNGAWVRCVVTNVQDEVYRVDYTGTYKLIRFDVADEHLRKAQFFKVGEECEVKRSNGAWVACKVTQAKDQVYRVDYTGTYKLIGFDVAEKHLRKIEKQLEYQVDDVCEVLRSDGTWVECTIGKVNRADQVYQCNYGELYKLIKFSKSSLYMRRKEKRPSTEEESSSSSTTTTTTTTGDTSDTENKDDPSSNYHSFVVKSFTFDIEKKYEPLKVKGSGAYGVVISAQDKVKNKMVAIKQINEWSEDWVDGLRIIREMKLLHHFQKHRHPNIIALDNLMASPVHKPFSEVYVVMDYMDTDMHKIIYSSNTFTNEHLQTWIHSALKGLKFLHSGKIIHRDIKPANLLLNKDCHLKLCDFGLARGFGKELPKHLTEYVVTRWYRAPELMCSCPYGPKVDVWALGCILGELIQRRPMFQGKDYKDQITLIINKLGPPSQEDIAAVDNKNAQKYINQVILDMNESDDYVELTELQAFKDVDQLAVDLLLKMLQFNPEKRITAEEALDHEWIKHLGTDDSDLCPEAPNFAFETVENLPINDRVKLREAMWKLIRQFHPELPKERNMQARKKDN